MMMSRFTHRVKGGKLNDIVRPRYIQFLIVSGLVADEGITATTAAESLAHLIRLRRTA
jgi:glycerate-2-kinase